MARETTVSTPKRGEIYLINFDPTVGAEIKKTRPALIVQNDIANRHSPLTIVCAITSKYDEPLYPTEVLIPAPEGGMKINSAILANQIRSVDKQRLVRRLGSLKSATMQKVDRALKLHLLLVSSIPLSRFGISSSQQTIVDFGRIRPGGFQKR